MDEVADDSVDEATDSVDEVADSVEEVADSVEEVADSVEEVADDSVEEVAVADVSVPVFDSSPFTILFISSDFYFYLNSFSPKTEFSCWILFAIIFDSSSVCSFRWATTSAFALISLSSC